MRTLPAAVSDAERAVHHHKGRTLLRAMAAILAVARGRAVFSPADVPEDVVPEADRQGCASNAWNALVALEIVERLPQTFNHAGLRIFAGRTKNTNKGAKGRWTACYRLRSPALADAWLRANGFDVPAPAPTLAVQTEMEVSS